jgi:class 3 adenylate cyclase/tetratricopeptide (TPR) repeat protein
LQKAHDAGIVHRDLKPANIMITTDNEPVIMDFGLARRQSAGEVELTDSRTVMGSPAYMAPEQVEARHDEVGPATDVYALGVILYQMVSGWRPFEGSAASIFGQIVSRLPEPPSKRRADVSPQIDAICLKALQKSPSKRHASAAEFVKELDRFLTTPELSLTATYHVRDEVPAGESVSESFADSASTSRPRREAELRQVTVAVFNYDSDVSASSSDSSTTHAEQLRDQADLFAGFVRERVTRFGGTMVPSSGQELITCFGFPVAFEDAAQRAVRAGLQVLRDLSSAERSSSLLPSAEQCWVSVHSGEAIAEEVGDDSGISLVGEARNTAVRIDSVAEAGALLISAATQQRVRLLFECESLGERRIRGVAQPVELFKVLKEAASRNRVELVDPGNLTPLIGRDTELSILKDRWEQALEELGQIVLLIGDAGLGKSRLIRELREHVTRESDDEVAIIELRCSQYHLNTGYFPMVEFLSRLLAFEGQSPAERLETVVRYLTELKLDTPENVALLCGMLSVPTDERFPPLALSPQKLKERSEELLLNWLKRLEQARPVLFIVEDLHWVDPSTLELLERHVAQFESGRVLSVLTFRPEFETPWKSKPHQTQIALNRLTKRQIAEMMRKRSGRTDIPDVIVNQVVERTDGVPLFIEEFTSLIVESGLLDRDARGDGETPSLMQVIPATLHDLLLARLDRMASNRDVIQLAATIGREFRFELLAAASSLPPDDLRKELDKLIRAEILFQKGQGAEAAYIFKHALLQDAAYRSMLTKKRQASHQRIAEVMEERFPDVVATQPELLAQHFTEAAVLDKAIQYWMKAGQRSQDQCNNREAIHQFERGLSVVMSMPASPERDMLELGFKLPLSAVLMGLKGYAAPEVEPVQNRCIEICRAIGGPSLFAVLAANWEWLFIRGRFKDSHPRGPELVKLAEELKGPGLLAEAYWPSGCTAFYGGNYTESCRCAELGTRYHDRDASIEFTKTTQQNSGPLNLSYHGMALWHLGFADQGFARHREALRMAEGLNHLFSLQMNLWKIAQTYGFAAMPHETIDYAKRCKKIADEQGFAFWVALAIGEEGIGFKYLGRFKESVESLRTALAQLEATGSFIIFPKYRSHLAESLWQSGQRDAAQQQLDQAFADQLQGEYMMHAELLRVRGDFARDSNDLAAAESSYREAIAVAQQQGTKMNELRATLHLARLDQSRGNPAAARERLEPLYNWFTEGFDMPDLKAAKSLLASL